MDYIEQMLADLGDNSVLIIRRDEKNGNVFRGEIYSDNGPMAVEMLTAESPCLDPLIGELDRQAEEWLRREQ